MSDRSVSPAGNGGMNEERDDGREVKRQREKGIDREQEKETERPLRGRDRRDDSIKALFVRGLAQGTRFVFKCIHLFLMMKNFNSLCLFSAEDLTAAFENYGNVKDEADKAFDKIEYLTINGRRLTVEWAQGDRKTPIQMKSKEGSGGGRRRSSDRYRSHRSRSRSRSRDRGDNDRRRLSRSRSRSPPHRRNRSESRDVTDVE
ncbi:hypothetical protein HK100_002855 [Physocladia obscura]|uniref:RRM domain-containing protein n=1 Tax=Physocladia obscura TaxID=109957 RepID=A0AAD5T703_9FUNG|nr:hypothetical protein HK100_002855 [Physocladia obscura]